MPVFESEKYFQGFGEQTNSEKFFQEDLKAKHSGFRQSLKSPLPPPITVLVNPQTIRSNSLLVHKGNAFFNIFNFSEP